MTSYRFRFSLQSKLISEVCYNCIGDLDALDEAEKFASEFDVEVWRGDRFVARVKQGNAAPKPEDRLAG